MSATNVGEIYYITERRFGSGAGEKITKDIFQLPLEIQQPDMKQILAAARIKAQYPLSYVDAFVVALSQKINGIIVTGDPEFRNIEDIAEIIWL